MPPPYSVCIIGAGPQGLAALKNLLELNRPGVELFKPEILELRDALGGLWAYSDDTRVPTVLQSTLCNVSKWKTCYGDFPVDDAWKAAGKSGDAPVYLKQADMLMYLKTYAHHFDLNSRIRFGVEVTALAINKDGSWEVTIKETASGSRHVRNYDKVIIASGAYSTPMTPKLDGIANFEGDVIHASAFKNADQFIGKKVLVVGFGSTAVDTATELVDKASDIYISHRRGNYIFPRIIQGKPLDIISNRRMNDIKNTVGSFAPVYFQGFMDGVVRKISDGAFKDRLNPKWRFRPMAGIAFSRPIISDSLVPLLESGAITSVHGPKRVVSANTVELDDSSSVQVDAIILCTGYKHNTILHSIAESSGNPPLPRLYENIFHPEYAQSLAYMDSWFVGTGICEAADLISMTIAQVFSGRYNLPSLIDMNRQIDLHHKIVRGFAAGETGPISSAIMCHVVNEGRWRTFLHEAAGTEVNQKLGYGVEGWRFWWRDKKLCDLLMGGIESPALYRLFEGREGARPMWSLARDAIEKANKQVIDYQKASKRKSDGHAHFE